MTEQVCPQRWRRLWGIVSCCMVLATCLLGTPHWAWGDSLTAPNKAPWVGVATFQKPGQVCLEETEIQALLESFRRNEFDGDAKVVITAYSDGLEFREPYRPLQPECVAGSVPESLAPHDRIAALRAVHVLEQLRSTGHGAFQRQLAFVKSTAADVQSAVAIIAYTAQTQATGPTHRRVEVRVEPNRPLTPRVELAVTCEPPPLATLSGPRPQTGISAASASGPDSTAPAWRRPAGWLGLAVGSSLVALSAGLLAGGGALTNQGVQSLDAERRQFFGERAYEYFLGGGVAAGLGVGLTAGAVYLLLSSQSERKAASGMGLNARTSRSQTASDLVPLGLHRLDSEQR